MLNHLVRKFYEAVVPGARAKRESQERDRAAAEVYRFNADASERARIHAAGEEAKEVADLRRIQARGYRGRHRGEGISSMIVRLLGGVR